MEVNKGFSYAHLLDGADIKQIDFLTERRSPSEVVKAVIAELGNLYEPMPRRVLVRSDPPLTMTPGGLLLTNKESSFWAGQAHKKVIKATVIAAGEFVEYAVGDRICFTRLHFSWIKQLEDTTYFGCIALQHIIGYIEEEIDQTGVSDVESNLG